MFSDCQDSAVYIRQYPMVTDVSCNPMNLYRSCISSLEAKVWCLICPLCTKISIIPVPLQPDIHVMGLPHKGKRKGSPFLPSVSNLTHSLSSVASISPNLGHSMVTCSSFYCENDIASTPQWLGVRAFRGNHGNQKD